MSTTRTRSRTLRQKNQGTITKSVTKSAGKEVTHSAETTERIDGCDHPNPAYVGAKLGYTKNLGNFESLRLDVNLSLPVVPTEAGMRDGFDFVSSLCEELISLEMENAQDLGEELGGEV